MIESPAMKRRILTIDDNAALRQFIQRTLTKKLPEHVLSFACAGAEGLGVAASEKPDLILLDFGLPDIAGDEVCRGLQADAETAGLPVILMGNQTGEMKRTQGAFENVIQIIPKPFTADLLGSAVARALQDTAKKLPADGDTKPGALAMDLFGAGKDLFQTPSKSAVKYAQDTSRGTVLSVLLDLERDEFTGLVTITAGKSAPIELHLRKGRPCLTTTRDVVAYLACSGFQLTPKQTEALERLRAEQTRSGDPIFLRFAEEKLMSRRKAVALCEAQNHRLFAALWLAGRAKFLYEANAALPVLAKDFAPFAGTMTEWAIESFKLAGQDLSVNRSSGKLFSLF